MNIEASSALLVSVKASSARPACQSPSAVWIFSPMTTLFNDHV